jgi:membrane protein required for colicin V production
MATLDWIFAAVLLGSMLLGAWRGLVYEVLSLVSWMAAFALAQWLASRVGAMLPFGGLGQALRYAAGFLLVFVVSVFVGGLLAFGASRMLSAVGLRPIDRLLGAMFGMLRGVVLLLATTMVVGLTPWKSATEWRSAKGVQWAGSALAMLQPVLPQEFGKYLPSS